VRKSTFHPIIRPNSALILTNSAVVNMAIDANIYTVTIKRSKTETRQGATANNQYVQQVQKTVKAGASKKYQ
jgi:hypothetical protein